MKFSPSRLAVSGGSKRGSRKRRCQQPADERGNFAERGNLTYQDFCHCRNSSGTRSPCKHRIAEVQRRLIASLRRKAHFQFRVHDQWAFSCFLSRPPCWNPAFTVGIQVEDGDGAAHSAGEEAKPSLHKLEEAISDQRNLQTINTELVNTCQTLGQKTRKPKSE